MATLDVVLTVSSSDATTEPLQISQSDTVTVVAPLVNTSRYSIGTVSPTLLLDSTVHTSDTWVYLKNTDATNYVTIDTDAAVNFAKLEAGEITWFKLTGAVGLELTANTASVEVEFGYWTI